MIKIIGELAIKQIDGRYGPFNVGELICEEGVFSAKYSLLDQYDPGVYQGEFYVSKIKSSPVTLGSSGRLLIETQAVIEDIQLTTFDENMDAVSDLQEPEPEFSNEEETVEEISEVSSTVLESPEESLFGKLWPLGESVQLDSTEDRSLLRKQIDYLNSNGYTLDFRSQVFHKNNQ